MTSWYCVCKTVGSCDYHTEVVSQEEFAALVEEYKADWDFQVVDVSRFADSDLYFSVLMTRKGE